MSPPLDVRDAACPDARRLRGLQGPQALTPSRSSSQCATFRNSRSLRSKAMLALALLSFCAAGWAAAAPHDEDLRASVVFNQLAIAQVLDNLSNISQGDAAVTTQLAQLSQSQKAQMQQISDDLTRVTSSVDILSKALTSHLQLDDVINRGTFTPSELVEKVKAQENEMQKLLQRRNQTAAVIRQLEEQSLQLQNEVDLKHQESQQKEDSIAQLNASIQKVKDENQQLLARGSDMEAEEASLQEKIQALKDQVTGKKTMYSQKQAIKDQLDQQLAELESNENEIRQEMAQLDEEIRQLQQKKTAVEGEHEAQLETNANLKETRENGLATSGSLQAAVEELKGRARNVETQNESLKRQKKSAEDELGRLRATLTSLNNKKNPMKRRMEESIKFYMETCLYVTLGSYFRKTNCKKRDEPSEREIILLCNTTWKHFLLPTEIRSCTNISEALQTRTSLNENLIREQQEANAQLEAKRREAEERIRQARITKQQLQQQLLQLQTDELQRKHEEVQVKTENLEAKTRLQRIEGEKVQMRNEIAKLEQDLQLANERIQHTETLIPSLRQKIDLVTSALIQRKNEKVDERTSLSQSVNGTEERIKRLTAENSHLQEEIEHTKADDQTNTRTKTELEQKIDALNTQESRTGQKLGTSQCTK
ncbi:putative leucine-rich repeat-containing protein DDB_G0290503 [Penaeus chinensis]|uniref:putative leucine-rich repeat-containing protein DDB_G0290503 n=1 Tax=Penaeus chinensis TaxID=139456 RepID=UPI001FB82514|nr:putative leucine-rich repeat-containing protein DDB_G0290503 [Penaeus chinensis]